ALLTEASDLDATGRSDYVRRLRQQQHAGIASVRADAGGRYRFSNLPRRSVTLVARAPGFSPSALQVVPPGEAPGELVVTRLSGLAGVVSEAMTGRPVSFFQVLAERTGDGGGKRATMIPRDFDEPRGEFAVDRLEPGRYLVAVRSAGYLLWHR